MNISIRINWDFSKIWKFSMLMIQRDEADISVDLCIVIVHQQMKLALRGFFFFFYFNLSGFIAKTSVYTYTVWHHIVVFN